MEGKCEPLTYFQVSKEEMVADFSSPKLAKQNHASVHFSALYVQCFEVCKFSTRIYV